MPLIRSLAVEIIEVPLRHPFATARDHLSRQVSRPVVVSAILDDGRIVCAEAAPVEYVTGETQASVEQDMRSVGSLVVGADVRRIGSVCDAVRAALPGRPAAVAAVEALLHHARAMAEGGSLWRSFGGALERLETDITLSITHEAAERAREAVAAGFRLLKLKLSGEHGEDLQRIRDVVEAAPGTTLRLDANQAYSADGILRLVDAALDAGAPIQLVEQPVPREDIAGLDAAARRCPAPVFADEAICSPSDALRVLGRTCVQGVNVKLMKSGIQGALDIIAITRAEGRRLMIGCMLETRRGLRPSIALALGTGAFEYYDLDSHLLLREEGECPWFGVTGPWIEIDPDRAP